MGKKDDDYKVTEHQLFISPLSLWWKLRRQNKIASDKRWMAFKVTLFVLISAPFRGIQNLYLRRKLKQINLNDKPPVFVLGHWRSGTTHLHYILSQDDRFSHLTSFQAFFFNVAFVSKRIMKPVLRYAMPKTRPQDNVKIDEESPQEEEHPLVNTTHRSGMHTFFFPKNISYFNKYNLFQGVEESEKEVWKKEYYSLLQHIALFNGLDQKLLLKNPHNTARLDVLSELFPESKFIFIHRNPYNVYSSMRILYDKAIKSQFLQDFSDDQIHERILYTYESVLKGYLQQKQTIGVNLEEVSYRELTDDPIGTIERVYSKLELGGFEEALPNIEQYLNSVRGFSKNAKPKLPNEIIREINERWSFAFEEWGYTKSKVD